MKNLNLIGTATFVLTSAFASAQIQTTPVHGGGNQVILSKEKSQAATGSMFTNEKFMPAKVSNYDKTVLVRYNAYSDHFELNDPIAGTTSLLPARPGTTITITSTGDTYTIKEYKTKDEETKSGYLSIISEKPNVSIYKRERIYLQPEVFPANSYASYKPANYKKVDDEFYISLKGGDAMYFSGKKDLAKLVPAKSKEILEFIKKNKLDLEKESDVEQLGNYLDSIL